MANRMKEVARLFGVKLEEVFYIEYYCPEYVLTNYLGSHRKVRNITFHVLLSDLKIGITGITGKIAMLI